MSDWINVSDEMPEGDEVVLIHVIDLGKQGITSAWWYSERDTHCWVVLDDDVNYDFDRVDFWRPNIALPTY